MPELGELPAPAAPWPAAESSSDEEIVSRVLSGDRNSYELIMRRYNQRLFRIVRAILGDDDEAEDVLQETYVRAYEGLRQFAGRAQFSTWLTKIGVHEALARRDKRRRLQLVDFLAEEHVAMAPHQSGSGPEQAAVNQELRRLLAAAVDGLPDELRDVVALRLIEGLGTRETAECMHLTEANVKVRLHRAKAALRARIDAQIGAEVRKLYEFGGARCDRTVRRVMKRIATAES